VLIICLNAPHAYVLTVLPMLYSFLVIIHGNVIDLFLSFGFMCTFVVCCYKVYPV